MVGNKSRVFKVIKTPVETQESLPEPIKRITGDEFFAVKDGAPLELDPSYGQEYAQLYNQKVAKLAWEVAQLIKALEAGRSATDDDSKNDRDNPQVRGKPTVYLCRMQLRPKAGPGSHRMRVETPRLSGSSGSAVA